MCHTFDQFLNVTAHNWFPEVAFENYCVYLLCLSFCPHVSKTFYVTKSNMYMKTEGYIYIELVLILLALSLLMQI